MKSTVTLVLLMLVGTLQLAGDLSVINGTDWESWSTETKEVYVIGFMSAYGVVRYKAAHEAGEAGSPLSESETAHLEREYSFEPYTVGEIRSLIDRWYRDNPGHTDYPLYVVILFATGKNYW